MENPMIINGDRDWNTNPFTINELFSNAQWSNLLKMERLATQKQALIDNTSEMIRYTGFYSDETIRDANEAIEKGDARTNLFTLKYINNAKNPRVVGQHQQSRDSETTQQNKAIYLYPVAAWLLSKCKKVFSSMRLSSYSHRNA